MATYLNGFIRHCQAVRIANLAQLVNAIAPIFTSRTGLFLQTIYHPLRLYAEHTRPVALDVHVEGPIHDLPAGLEERTHGRVHRVADLGPFSLLDAVATSRRRAGASSRSASSTATATGLTRQRSTSAAPRRPASSSSRRSTAPTSARRTRSSTRTAWASASTGGRSRATGSSYEFPAHSVSVLRVRLAS